MNEYYPEGWLKDDPQNRFYKQSLKNLITAKENGVILESPVIMCDQNKNMTVNLGAVKGIIKREDGAVGISEGQTRDIALISRVGRPVCFTVEEIKENENGVPYAVLSRKKAQLLCLNNKLNLLYPGDIISAKITRLEPFGAFCDIGCGNIALLPIDSISVSRIRHPSDRFFVGQNIKAVVKSRDENGRITLSLKELLGTWEENAEKFSEGETVSGIVRSVESYGIFVELAPNLAGLAEPKEDVKVGQTASVYIKSIIKDKMKIKLIIIDSFDETNDKKFSYFYDGDRIDEFNYSPECAKKQITTRFI